MNRRIPLSLMALLALAVVACTSPVSAPGTEDPPVVVKTNFAIGDIGPSGVGKVFYISSEGAHGYEAAPANWNGASGDPSVQWKTVATETVGASFLLIGQGAGNTMFATQTSAAIALHPAAARCIAYTGGGKSDWFLPSHSELYEMYLKRASIDSLSSTGSYWTSTQIRTSYEWRAYALSFAASGNNPTTIIVTSNGLVRPIRAF